MTAADYLNAKREVTLDGKTYAVRNLENDQLMQLAQWLKDRAIAEIDRQPIPDAQKAQDRKAVYGDFAAGFYDPGGPVFNAVAMTLVGAAKSLYIALSEHHPEVTQEQCSQWARDEFEKVSRIALEAAESAKSSSQVSSRPGGSASRGSGTKKAGRSKKSGSSHRRK